MPHRESVPEQIVRRLNGIGLDKDSSDALDRIQNAEDISAQTALRKAVQVYDQMRLLRAAGTLAWIDPNTNQVSEVELP